MKKTLLTTLLSCLAVIAVTAKDLTILWDYWTNGNFIVYKNGQQVGFTTNKIFVVPNLMPGTYTISVVASNGLLSDPVTLTTNVPLPVVNLRIEVSSSGTLNGVQTLRTNFFYLEPATDSNRFYVINTKISYAN